MKSLTERARAVAAIARPLDNDLSEIVAAIGDAQVVLLGEASHGTHEFYDVRARLTQRLIDEKNFRALALEADWPDALRVHRYVQNRGDDRDARSSLGDFRRFPHWMWRNEVVLEFVEWLRGWNKEHADAPVGFYGIDLYSLHASIAAVLSYLGNVDPVAARRARERYACFDHFGSDPQTYGYAATQGMAEPCEEEVVAQLLELRKRAREIVRQDGEQAEEEVFFAEQNARLIANAERYYRSMFRGRASSWNLRDEHMAGTIESLRTHLDGGRTKIVVWAHNSHLGDARATEMSERGEWNVGQLMRERLGREVCAAGFSTHSGTVTAAQDWDQPAERKRVRPGLRGSYEELLHAVGMQRFWLDLRSVKGAAADSLGGPLLQRAIGVIYRPETERWSHYFEACLTRQFDLLIHLDKTRALDPLERTPQWEAGEVPETFPSSL